MNTGYVLKNKKIFIKDDANKILIQNKNKTKTLLMNKVKITI